VVKDLLLSIQGGILLGALFGLGVIVLAVVLTEVLGAWKIWRERRKAVALSLLAVAAIIVGGTKPSHVNFPRTDPEVAYLIDNGSYVSNNVVHVDFNTFLIPGDAPITLAYWPNESTNEADFVELFTYNLSAWPRPLDFEFENAISNRWYCYTTWTPGPAAHTNGVFQQVWMSDRRENRNAIPIRTIIIEDGEQIAPPHFERKEEP
jgi:hypothetical protein